MARYAIERRRDAAGVGYFMPFIKAQQFMTRRFQAEFDDGDYISLREATSRRLYAEPRRNLAEEYALASI